MKIRNQYQVTKTKMQQFVSSCCTFTTACIFPDDSKETTKL